MTGRRRFPDAFTFLVAMLAGAAVLTWLMPAGEYERRHDEATGRDVVVAGTYHEAASSPVGPFAALVAVPRGFADASPVIAFVFLVGAGFTVVDKTGALRAAVDWLIARLSGRASLLIQILCVVFAAGGLLEGMMEEIIPLIPMIVVVAGRLGYSPIAALAISLGMATVGGASSPLNPFQVGIAQKLAGLPLVSAWGFRMAVAVPMLLFTMWRIARLKRAGGTLLHADANAAEARLDRRTIAVLAIVAAAFAAYLAGVIALGWDFDQMAALFLLMGIAAGFAGGLGLDGTVGTLVDGFRGMAYAGVLIGVSRAIYLVLADGRIIDTIVSAMLVPVSHLPRAGAVVAMMLVQTILHVPVPSTSGQAVLTMPVLVPLSDLLGIARQVTVLAYQYGAGLCEMITPTNGAMMAMLAAAGVQFDDWLRFAVPLFAALMALAAAALMLAVVLGVS